MDSDRLECVFSVCAMWSKIRSNREISVLLTRIKIFAKIFERVEYKHTFYDCRVVYTTNFYFTKRSSPSFFHTFIFRSLLMQLYNETEMRKNVELQNSQNFITLCRCKIYIEKCIDLGTRIIIQNIGRELFFREGFNWVKVSKNIRSLEIKTRMSSAGYKFNCTNL